MRREGRLVLPAAGSGGRAGGVRKVFTFRVTLWSFQQDQIFSSWTGMNGSCAPMIHPNMTSGNLYNAARILHNEQQQGQRLTYHRLPYILLDVNQREMLGFVYGNKKRPVSIWGGIILLCGGAALGSVGYLTATLPLPAKCLTSTSSHDLTYPRNSNIVPS